MYTCTVHIYIQYNASLTKIIYELIAVLEPIFFDYKVGN